MFDVVSFVRENNFTIAISGVENENLVGVGIQDDAGFLATDMIMVRQPDETDEQYLERKKAFFQRLAERIKNKRKQFDANCEKAQKRAELEGFFREDTQ